MAEPGTLEAFYASAWQHPGALWLAAGIGAALCLARRDLDPSTRAYCLVLAVLSAGDAWLTASHVVGIGALPASLASAVPLGFVLAGDLRYLLFVESARGDGRIAITGLGLARAVGLTLIVPVFAQVVASRLAPGNPRVLFLVYELAFCALTVALLMLHPQARALTWVRAVSGFVLLYYGLWAAADSWILAAGADLGFALRVVPNALYYGGLFAAIAWLAPASRR